MSSQNTHPNRFTGSAIAGFSTLMMIAILVLIQLIIIRHNHQFDLTSNKRFTLSEQTQKVLDGMETPVKAICFYNEEQLDYELVRDLLIQFDAASQNFKYEFVDLNKAPLLAQKYEINSYATTALIYGDQSRIITSPTEQEFTNALIKLTRGETKKRIYFLTLHGERNIDSAEADGLESLKIGLQNANYEVFPLNLLDQGRVPVDCSILVVAGPEQGLVSQELEYIDAYIQSGGSIMVFADPLVAPGLVEWLGQYGIILQNDLIIDPGGLQNPLQPIVVDYPPHMITESFPYQTVYHLARSIIPMDPPPEKIILKTLAQTAEACWGETDISKLDEFSPEYTEGADLAGPLSLAVTAEIRARSSDIKTDDGISKPRTARLVVFGDSDFITSTFIQSFPANGVLALNALHWLSEETDLIAIPPRDPISQPIHPTRTERLLAFAIPVIILPLLIIVTGITRIYLRRRR